MQSRIPDVPIVAALAARRPVFWINPDRGKASDILPALSLQYADILDAEARLSRFAPLISELFAEAAPTHGIIAGGEYRPHDPYSLDDGRELCPGQSVQGLSPPEGGMN